MSHWGTVLQVHEIGTVVPLLTDAALVGISLRGPEGDPAFQDRVFIRCSKLIAPKSVPS